jgi:hypothetical protein
MEILPGRRPHNHNGLPRETFFLLGSLQEIGAWGLTIWLCLKGQIGLFRNFYKIFLTLCRVRPWPVEQEIVLVSLHRFKFITFICHMFFKACSESSLDLLPYITLILSFYLYRVVLCYLSYASCFNFIASRYLNKLVIRLFNDSDKTFRVNGFESHCTKISPRNHIYISASSEKLAHDLLP